MIQTGGVETILSDNDSIQTVDQDQMIDTGQDVFEYSAEVLEVMQEFADTPMVYEREGEPLYAEGSYHAVQLCLYLQNHKLPANFFRRNFAAAAARRVELDAEKAADEADKEVSADLVDGQIDSNDDITQNVVSAVDDKQNAKPEAPVVEMSVDSQIYTGAVHVSNVSDQSRTTKVIPTITSMDNMKNTKVSAEKQSDTVTLDAKTSKKSSVATLQANTSSSKQSDSEHNLKSKPVLDDLLVERNKQREVRVVDRVRVPEVGDRSVNNEIALYEKVEPNYRVDDDVAAYVLESVPDEFTSAVLLVDEPGIASELDEDVTPTLETTFSTYIENIQDDEYVQVDDVEESISNQSIILEQSKDDKAMPETEIIVELNHLLEYFALNHSEESQFQRVEQFVETKVVSEVLLNDEHVAALYQCLEAQVQLLTETERTACSVTNKLPRQIEVTLETFFEEIGVEDPELAARLYTEKYGVNQLLDIVAPMPLRKTTIAVALSERYHRMAQFITSLLHDDGKLAQVS